MIPAAYAAGIDDSASNGNLAVDDSTDLTVDGAFIQDCEDVVDDGAFIQDDSSSNDLNSASLKESGTNQDEKAITQDELMEDSDDDSEEADGSGSDDDPEEDPDEGDDEESDDNPDVNEEDDAGSDDDAYLDEEDDAGSDDDSDDSDEGDHESGSEDGASSSHYTDDPYVYYSRLPEIYPELNIDFNHTPKTILEPKIEQSFAVFISARFLDNDGNPLKDTEVILLVDYEEYRTRTDEDGVAVWDLMLSGDYFFAIINPVTGECYIFPELMHVSFYSNATVGFRRDGNTHMFTVNSNGLKSTIKNDKGIVSKAITFSKDKVIISTKTNDSIDQMVIDRFTRYSIYLIAILCILVPIGILRYRKK